MTGEASRVRKYKIFIDKKYLKCASKLYAVRSKSYGVFC